jgi:phenylalanyl-tRNA synthetase beta chain
LIPRNAIAFGENAIALHNPLSEDHVALRPSLLTGLLGVLDRNIRAGAERVAIFEIGRVFEPPNGEERKRAALLLWGDIASQVHWRGEKRPLDFFDLKGAIELIRTDKLSFQRGQHSHMALAVEVVADKDVIGFAGQLSNSLSSKVDASGAVLVAEISLDFLEKTRGSHATFREFGKFPAMTRDIAMIVADTLSHEEIWKVIDEPKEPLLDKVAFFDHVVGKEAEQLFGPGKKSVAYRLTYRDKNRTLTNEEVTEVHARIRERLKRELGVTLRE